MGASQAAIMFFRRPDLFDGILALSGCYDMSYFWNWWVNNDIYNNSPALFLQNMSKDHHYINNPKRFGGARLAHHRKNPAKIRYSDFFQTWLFSVPNSRVKCFALQLYHIFLKCQ